MMKIMNTALSIISNITKSMGTKNSGLHRGSFQSISVPEFGIHEPNLEIQLEMWSKVQTSRYEIISSQDVTYNMVTVVNTAMWCTGTSSKE